MSSESNFSFTTKVNGDLFTVRGDTYDDFLSHLVTAGSVAGVKVLLSALDGSEPEVTMEQAINNVTAVFGAPASTTFEPVAPVGIPQPAVSSEDKSCSHGVMIKRTGSTAKGEWRAFFCPTPKDTPGQCTPVFAKRGTAEWNAF